MSKEYAQLRSIQADLVSRSDYVAMENESKERKSLVDWLRQEKSKLETQVARDSCEHKHLLLDVCMYLDVCTRVYGHGKSVDEIKLRDMRAHQFNNVCLNASALNVYVALV